MTARDEIYAYLGALGIEYTHTAHAPVRSIDDCKWAQQRLHGLMPKNLLLTPRNTSAYTLLIAHPRAIFRTSDISKQLGSARLSFAGEPALEQYLHTSPGALSPMGLIFESANGVRFAVDEALRDEPALLFHPNDNRETLAMSGPDFFERFLPGVGHEPTFVTLGNA